MVIQANNFVKNARDVTTYACLVLDELTRVTFNIIYDFANTPDELLTTRLTESAHIAQWKAKFAFNLTDASRIAYENARIAADKVMNATDDDEAKRFLNEARHFANRANINAGIVIAIGKEYGVDFERDSQTS
jgi:hypothetical protein